MNETLGVRARRRDPIGPVDIVCADPLAVLSTSVRGARAMTADELRARVADAYTAVGRALTAIGRVPIRFWNFVPDPGDPMGGGLDRYMVFNAGRFDGYTQWLGASNEFGRLLPTASAVGVIGDDLVDLRPRVRRARHARRESAADAGVTVTRAATDRCRRASRALPLRR